MNGVIYKFDEVRIANITDGTSNTYLLGEKYIDPLHYADGMDAGDNQPFNTGYDLDSVRWSPWDAASNTYLVPAQDQEGVVNYFTFGSAHPSGFNMAFCDGSVHRLSFSIDPNIHACLCNRKDGRPIDGRQF